MTTEKAKRKQGTPRRQKGYVFRKTNKSPYWTLQYFERGKRVRMACGKRVRTKEEAGVVLADRLAKVRAREAVETRKGKVLTTGRPAV